MRRAGVIGIALVAALVLCACASSSVMNVGRGSGYKIEFVAAKPMPGTTLLAGSVVPFEITVRYELVRSDSGTIILVFEDEKDGQLLPGSQVAREVGRGSREVTLSQEVKIPSRVSEVRLYVPLRPEGLFRTSGELLLKYPVRRSP